MLSPGELEAVPAGISRLYRGLQLDIMRDIVERLSVNHDISRTADWEITRLYELGVAKEVIKRHIRRTLGLTADEINRIYAGILAEDYARYEPIYKRLGKSFIPFRENQQLQQLIGGVKKQTLGDFKNITQSLGFAVRHSDGTRTFQPLAKAYQATLDKAAFGMLSGVYDYNTMIKRAVKELTDSGLRAVDYTTEQDGDVLKIHSNRVEVAARRALMTGFHQVVAKITEDNAEQLGTNHFEVTYHRGARPTHQPWQGRVYTKEQLVTVCGYGEVDGLKGANCYHDFHLFFPGISKRLYTDEQLDRMNEEENTPKPYGDRQYTTYEALQRQRRMETALRRKREEIDLLEKGGAEENDILAAKAKYHALSDEYAKFSKAMHLPQQRERVSIDGRKGVNVSFGKSIANPENSGIMKAGSGDMALEYQRYGRNKNTLVNKTYIDSGEYRRKFDNATENASVNKTLYDSAKAALKHRSGTLYEDMYWIDGNSGKVVFSVTDSTLEEGIPNTDSIKRHVKSSGNIITLHSHPGSMPPSASDLNSNFFNNYKMGFVACHNGVVFGYTSNEEISETLYTMYINKFLNDGFDDFTAQMKTLQVLSQNYKIKIWEVSHNG